MDRTHARSADQLPPSCPGLSDLLVSAPDPAARWHRRLAAPCLAVVLALWGQAALAIVDVNKAFNPININPGQTSTLTITLLNSETYPVTSVGLLDELPVGVTATAVVSNGCGGTASVSPSTQVSLSGGTIPAGDGITSGTCQVSVTVTATAAGTYVNTIPANPDGTLGTGVWGVVDRGSGDMPIGNIQSANATLTVSTSGITGLKSFSPSTIHVTGASTLTVTLNNPGGAALTNVSFTDALPVPLQVNDPVVTGGTCGGTFTDGTGGSLDPGETTFRVTGGTIPAASSCTFTLNVRVNPARVTVAQNGSVTNTIPANGVTTAQGATNAAAISGSITVQTGAQVVKAFAPATVQQGGSSTLTLTLRNYNLTAISPANLVDVMPAGITVLGPASTTCGGSASFTSTQVELAGGTIPPAPDPNASGFGSCTLTATVQGDTLGALVNSVPAGNFSGINYVATSGTLTVTPVAGPIGVSKAFSPTSTPQGTGSTLTITLRNTGTALAAITSFADNLTTMGSGFTIAASPTPSTSCGGTLTANPGDTLISLSGGTIPANGTCLVVVRVAVAPSSSTGTRTNTIPAGALVTDQGSNPTAATATLGVTQAAGVSKSWTPATVAPGGVSRLTITITHANGAPAFSSMAITDNLNSMGSPAHVIADPANVTNTCGGSVTATPGTQLISLSGGALGLGATSCQIGVDVRAPAGTGSARNRIPANTLTTAEGFTFNANADATLTRATRTVTLNKSFNPVVANGGGPSVASVTIANTKPNAIALTNVSLTDVLPPSVEVYAVPSPSFTGTGCSGGTITAVPGATSFSLAGASVAANATCTLSVTVTAFVDGNHINDIPAGALTSAQGATNDNNPSATLTVLRNINVSKYFSPNPMEATGSTTLTIRISNTNTVLRTLGTAGGDPGLVDDLPTGVTIAGAAATDCSGVPGYPGSPFITAPPGGTQITMTRATLQPGTACNLTVPVTVTNPGTYTNVIPASSIVTVEGSTNPDPAQDTLRVVAKPTIAKAFSPTSIGTGGTSTITFTLTNPNNATLLPGGFTGASFTDTLSGMSINANGNAGGTCTGASGNAFTTGQTSLSFSGLTIPAAGSCTVTIVVTAPDPGVFPNQTSGVSTRQTQTPGTPSPVANLTVLQRPTIAKSFAPDPINAGGVCTLTFTLTNPNPAAAVTLSSPAFTDVFPTTPGAMVVASPLTTSVTGCGAGWQLRDSGNSTLAAGDLGVRFNSGSIAAGGTCTITVNVTAPAGGLYANTTSVLTTSNAGTSLSPATDTLYARAADLAVTKAREPAGTWTPGTEVTYTIVVRNNGLDGASNAPVTDDIPAAILNPQWTCTGSGGGTCGAPSGSGDISTTVSLPVGATATIVATGTFDGSVEGTVSNTVTVGQPSDVPDIVLFNNSATVDAPTVPVTLAQVTVERRAGMVAVDWTTETEVANVGFNVWGLAGKERVRLNEELIAGALQRFEPQSYHFEVADAGLEAVLIEEVDIHGATRRHGPFAVGETYGAPPERVAIDWPSIQREQARLAREWEATLPTTPVRARLYVDRDGIVRVTAEALKAAGLSFDGQRIDSLAVLEQGAGIPVTVICASGAATARFGPGCYVEFPGAALDSLYTHTNVYTLALDRQKAKRIPLDTSLPSGDPVTTYQETTEVERERAYSETSPTGDPWYETTMLAYRRPVSKEFPIDIDSPQPDGGEATLEVGLWGVTDWPAAPDHHVVVELNGVRVGERTFDGTTDATMHLSVPRGVAKAGRNTLRLTLPGDTGVDWDMIAVDHYALTFARAAVARGGALTFGASAKTTAVRGLRGPVVAYRRLEGQAIVRVQPQLRSDGAEQLTLVPGSRLYGVYGVADASGLIQPRIGRDPGSSLSLAGQADLLIVTHPTFLPMVEKYAAYKRNAGLSVKVVDTQTAYDVYGGGVVGPQPIRTLIAQAAQRMGVTAVLLVGGDTYDYFDYTGAHSLSFVPTLYARTDSLVTFAPVDPLYGDITGDEVPDLPVGRWPVRSVAELEAVIAKTITFAQRTDAPWALLAADTADGTYSFRRESDTLSVLLPAGWAQTKAYADTLGIPATRQLILTSLSSGPLFANWFGHSSFGLWSFDRLFTSRDALALANAGRPFIVTQWGCWNTYHVLPSYDTLGHALLLTDNRGAAAVVGAATLTDSDNDRALASLFLPRLVQPGVSIGQALVDAKLLLAAARPEARDVILGTSLLGDPTLVLSAAGGAH